MPVDGITHEHDAGEHAAQVGRVGDVIHREDKPEQVSSALNSSRNLARMFTGMMKKSNSIRGRSGYSVAKAATKPKAPADAPTTGPANASRSSTPASAWNSPPITPLVK